MVENPLAFNFSKTRTICDAFDDAWTLLQGLGSDLTQAPKSLATQTILAKRIIEMADQGLRDIPALRDDALAFLEHSPRSASRNGLGGAIKARAAALAELENEAPGPFPRGGTSGLRPGEHVAHQGQTTTAGFSGISEDGMDELRLEIQVKRGTHSLREP